MHPSLIFNILICGLLSFPITSLASFYLDVDGDGNVSAVANGRFALRYTSFNYEYEKDGAKKVSITLENISKDS